MTKKHFIALADTIKETNHRTRLTHGLASIPNPFSPGQIGILADFCQSQNPNFNRQRWLDYIAGECGQNGGAVK